MHILNCAYSWAYIQSVPFRKADFYCFPGVYSVCAMPMGMFVRARAKAHISACVFVHLAKDPGEYQEA